MTLAIDLTGTKAIVSGGASGLGAATARYFANQGADVAILDRDETAAHRLAETIGARGYGVDVTDAAALSDCFAKLCKDLGGLNATVNCAGIAQAIKTVGREGPHPLEAFQRTIDINLVGSFNLARLAAAAMAENRAGPDGSRGVIINTASIAAYDGQKGQAAYAASKGGVVGMTLPMARDLASLGIRVMAIAPGIFHTPMLEGLGEEVMNSLAADVPCPPRLGNPTEFAQLAAFILRAGYLNGEVIRLDGALRLR